jgi:hypothetical protein
LREKIHRGQVNKLTAHKNEQAQGHTPDISTNPKAAVRGKSKDHQNAESHGKRDPAQKLQDDGSPWGGPHDPEEQTQQGERDCQHDAGYPSQLRVAREGLPVHFCSYGKSENRGAEVSGPEKLGVSGMVKDNG